MVALSQAAQWLVWVSLNPVDLIANVVEHDKY
jgi:hypothetical protein